MIKNISVVLTILIFVSGCSESNSSQVSLGNETSGQVEASYVCGIVGDTYVEYTDYLSFWRNTNNNVPYEDLFTYSDESSVKLQTLADLISTQGIDWDSGAIVASLIFNIAAGIDEISSSTQNRFFPPGRDLNSLLNEISLNAESVVTSACQ